MLSPRRLSFLLPTLILSMVIVLLAAQRAATRAGPERYGMTGEQYRKFTADAQRFGLTPEGLKKFIDQTIGTPLLYDPKRNLVVSYQAAPDGAAKTIHIVPVPNPAGGELASVRYELADHEGESRVTYSGSLLPSDNPRSVYWHDLNADGVFDQMLIPAKHHELLKLDQGIYVLLDGKWTAAERDEKMARDTVKVGGILHRFDRTAGRWIAK